MRFKRGPFLKVYLALARASLAVEYLWPALWPATALAALFIGLALFDIFSHLPLWLHGLLLLGFLGGFVVTLQRVFTRMPAIGTTRARHRIEESSDLAHRPLAALDDTMAIGSDDALANALWQAHQRRMAEASTNLRLRLPHAGLVGRDWWGLRAGLAALLILGIIAAGGDSMRRISRALVPPMSSSTAVASLELNIWITPPAYTNLPPVVLHVGGKDGAKTRSSGTETVSVPAGSALLAQLAGGGRAPDLVIGKKTTPFDKVDADSYHIEATLTQGDHLAVVQRGHEIGSWPLSVTPDRPPSVEFSAAPEVNAQQRVVLPYTASDDYGLKSLTASIRRLDGAAMPDGDDEILLRMPLPSGDKKQVSGKSNNDLLSHIWAGLPVLVHLIATDEHDQTGVSAVEPVVLPEREFRHPVAKELYDIRKRLTVKVRDRRLAVLKLDGVAEHPDRFGGDTATYLALRVTRERLRQDPANKAVADVQAMLWDAAIHLEEGVAANANRDLLAAQKALQDAMNRNASPEELDRLMNELRDALDKFMSALQQELEQRGDLMPLDPNMQTMDMSDINKMLEQMQELMRQGSREAAKDLMAQLQQMLDSLRSALNQRGQPGQQGQMNQAMREMQQGMRDLNDIIRRQEQLLDDTYRQQGQEPPPRQQQQPGRPGQQQQARPGQRNQPGQQQQRRGQQGQQGQQGQPGDQGDQNGQNLTQQQQELRKKLGELMQKFGDMLGQVPKGLGDAEGDMRQSEQALGEGQPGDAIDPETRALDALREGQQQAGQAMAQAMQQMMGQRGQGQQFQFGYNGGQFGPFNGPRLQGLRQGNRDPFGRQLDEGSNGMATGTVKIPDENQMARAREILDELRKRLGDLWRPELEMDYLRRLLRQF